VNLFAIGTAAGRRLSVDGARRAIEEVGQVLPGLDGRRAEGWTAPDGDVVAISLSHEPERVGGVRYACFGEGEMALFAGRPIVWTGAGEADGRRPLDPRFYLAPADRWREDLDGRYVAARWQREIGRAELFTDALGAYPVYSATAAGVTWVGNSPALLARLTGAQTLSPEVLCAFFACGWSLGGDATSAGVRRVPRGMRVTLGQGVAEERADLLPVEELASLFASDFDAAAAARAIAGASAALADWPGRPREVAITGGRDSRLALAGAVEAGFPFTAVTKAFAGQEGYPDTPDVVVARAICQALGLDHRVIPQGDESSPLSDSRRAAAILAVTGPGSVSLGDSLELPLAGAPEPFAVLLGGQGAELAKGAYATADGPSAPERIAGLLLDKASPAWPPRIVGREGERLVRAWLRDWASEQIERGVPPSEVPTLFHLLVRLGAWGGPGLTSRDVGLETTSPAWTLRLLPHQLSLPLVERKAGRFHARVLEELSPRLAALPYEQATTRGMRQKLVREARRRVERRLPAGRGHRGPGGPDHFATAFAQIREAVLTQPDHDAWQSLRRRRVQRLLRRDPGALDPRSRQQVLRLGTIFLVDRCPATT
jgi:hypothetical protein